MGVHVINPVILERYREVLSKQGINVPVNASVSDLEELAKDTVNARRPERSVDSFKGPEIVSLNPGKPKSVEFGVNVAGSVEAGDYFYGGGGFEGSLSFDDQSSGFKNVGFFAFGGIPLLDSSRGIDTGKASGNWDIDFTAGTTLIGSNTANAEQLGGGTSVEIDAIVEVRPLSIIGGYGELANGYTLTGSLFAPELDHYFTGFGGGITGGKPKLPSASFQAEALVEHAFPFEIENQSFNSSAYSAFSQVFETAGTLVNLFSNFGFVGLPGGVVNKPVTLNDDGSYRAKLELLKKEMEDEN